MSRGAYDMTDVKPLYRHNCTRCVFLGRYKDSGNIIHDLYYCAQNHSPSHGIFAPVVVGRHINNTNTFTWEPVADGWFFAEYPRHQLSVAYGRARERGLV